MQIAFYPLVQVLQMKYQKHRYFNTLKKINIQLCIHIWKQNYIDSDWFKPFPEIIISQLTSIPTQVLGHLHVSDFYIGLQIFWGSKKLALSNVTHLHEFLFQFSLALWIHFTFWTFSCYTFLASIINMSIPKATQCQMQTDVTVFYNLSP